MPTRNAEKIMRMGTGMVLRASTAERIRTATARWHTRTRPHPMRGTRVNTNIRELRTITPVMRISTEC
jgi:hypothetical protein